MAAVSNTDSIGQVLGGRFALVQQDGHGVALTVELSQREAEGIADALGWAPKAADPRTQSAGASMVWRLSLPELGALLAQLQHVGEAVERRAELDSQQQLPLGSPR